MFLARIKNLCHALAKRDLAPWAVIFCLFLFFAPTIFPARTFFYRDLIPLHFTHKAFFAETVRQGELPLWNSRLDLGIPYIGDLVAAPLYPLNILFLIFPAGVALKWFIIVHFVLAGLAACGLSRSLGNDGPAAAFAGTAYALCGYLVGIHWNLPYLLSAAWLPVVLWAWHGGGKDRFFPWRALAIPTAAALIIVGDPMLFLAVLGTLFFYVLFMIPMRGWFKTGGQGIIVAALALAAAALQLFPAYELYQGSERAAGLRWEEIAKWSFEPKRLLEFIYPFYYHASLPWPQRPAALNLAWVDTHYCGLLTLGLAIFAILCRRREGQVRWLAFTAVFYLILGMGGHTPLFRGLLKLLPWLQSFRYPEKYLVVSALAFCLLAGAGLKNFIALPASRGKMLLPLFVLAIAIASFALIPLNSPARLLPSPFYPMAIHLLVVALVFLGLSCLYYKQRISNRSAAWTLVFLTAFDLGLVTKPMIPTMAERDLFKPPPSLAAINAAAGNLSEPVRIYYDLRLQAMMPEDIAALEGADINYWPSRVLRDLVRLHPNSASRFGLEYAQGFSPFKLKDSYSLRPSKIRDFDVRLDFMNVRFIISPLDTDFPEARGYRLLATFPEAGCRILINENVLPRTYILTPAAASPYLKSGPAAPLPESTALSPMPQAETKILSYSPNRVQIRAQLPESGWLILADRFFPGWQATVDGRPEKINPFARWERAVALSRGRHLVEFSYRPRTFFKGGVISLLTLAGLLVVGVAHRKFSREGKNRRADNKDS